MRIKKLKIKRILLLLITVGFIIAYQLNKSNSGTEESPGERIPKSSAGSRIVNGREVQTGLVAGEGLETVKASCTVCHSSALILQNRFSREQWQEKIVWMQKTQGLWDLGKNEAVILDYLEANYAPEELKGRRRPLSEIEWYHLKD